MRVYIVIGKSTWYANSAYNTNECCKYDLFLENILSGEKQPEKKKHTHTQMNAAEMLLREKRKLPQPQNEWWYSCINLLFDCMNVHSVPCNMLNIQYGRYAQKKKWEKRKKTHTENGKEEKLNDTKTLSHIIIVCLNRFSIAISYNEHVAHKHRNKRKRFHIFLLHWLGKYSWIPSCLVFRFSFLFSLCFCILTTSKTYKETRKKMFIHTNTHTFIARLHKKREKLHNGKVLSMDSSVYEVSFCTI